MVRKALINGSGFYITSKLSYGFGFELQGWILGGVFKLSYPWFRLFAVHCVRRPPLTLSPSVSGRRVRVRVSQEN